MVRPGTAPVTQASGDGQLGRLGSASGTGVSPSEAETRRQQAAFHATSIARPGTIGAAAASAALSVYTLPRRQLDAIATTMDSLGSENSSLHFELDVLRRRARRFAEAEDDNVSATLASLGTSQLAVAKAELTKLVERLLELVQEREQQVAGLKGMVVRTREVVAEREQEVGEWKERLTASTAERHRAENAAEKYKGAIDELKEQVRRGG